MSIYLQQIDYDIWNIVEEGYETLMIIKENKVVVKDRKDWDENDKRKFSTNAKVMNTLFCSLDKNEFNKISTCKTVQSIWKTLEITYEKNDSREETSGSEIANPCLMVIRESDNEVNSSSFTSTSSTSTLSYDELLYACDELQNELTTFGKKYKDLKKKCSNILYENDSLKNENNFLKTQLDSISKNETNDILRKRVDELTNVLSRFTQRKENLDKLLFKDMILIKLV